MEMELILEKNAPYRPLSYDVELLEGKTSKLFYWIKD